MLRNISLKRTIHTSLVKYSLYISVRFFFFCTVPPLTVQILPIVGNGHFGRIDDDSHPPPFTQSSAKMTPLPLPDGGDRLAVHGGGDVQEHRQMQPLTAGRKYELPCRAYGSRPPAKLTWWMDGRRLDTTRETVSKRFF